MPGPYSPNHRLGADGPPFSDTHPSQPIPTQPAYSDRRGEPVEQRPRRPPIRVRCHRRSRTRNAAVDGWSSALWWRWSWSPG